MLLRLAFCCNRCVSGCGGRGSKQVASLAFASNPMPLKWLIICLVAETTTPLLLSLASILRQLDAEDVDDNDDDDVEEGNEEFNASTFWPLLLLLLLIFCAKLIVIARGASKTRRELVVCCLLRRLLRLVLWPQTTSLLPPSLVKIVAEATGIVLGRSGLRC